MRDGERAVRNTIIVLILTGSAVIVGYLFRVLLAKNLAPAEYGLFFAVFNFVMFFFFFTAFGMDQALIKFIPEFLAVKRQDLVKGSIMFVFIVRLIFSTIISLALFLGSDYLAIHYFHTISASLLLKYFAIVLWLISFFILNAAFNGYQHTTLLTLMDFLKISLVFLFTIILLHPFKNVFAPTFAYIISFTIMPFVITFLFLKYTFPDFFRTKCRVPKKLVKRFIFFGLSVSLAGIGTMILNYTDTIFLTYYRGFNDVALYNVSLPIVTLLWLFAQGISFVLLPLASELWFKKKKNMLARWVEKLQKYLFILIMPFILLILVYPALLIRILFDAKYISATMPLQILAIGTIFYSLAFVNTTVLIGIGKPKLVSKIVLVAAMLNLFLCFLLIPKYGPGGAALVFALSYLTITVLTTIYLSKILGFAVKLMDWAKILFSSLIFLFVVNAMKISLNMNLYLVLVISLLIGTTLYFALLELFKVFSLREFRNLLKKGLIRNKVERNR